MLATNAQAAQTTKPKRLATGDIGRLRTDCSTSTRARRDMS
jgi:hypothetical protein